MKNKQKKYRQSSEVKSLQNGASEQYVKTKQAMLILGIKSQTTIEKYETNGKIKACGPVSNRKRYMLSELLKIQSKR